MRETSKDKSQKQEAANNGNAPVNCCALLEELQLKLIGMQAFAQEHYNEVGYSGAESVFGEIRSWIKQKRSQHCS